MGRQQLLRSLPAVDRLLREPPVQKLLEAYPRKLVLQEARDLLQELRRHLMEAGEAETEKVSGFELSTRSLADEVSRRVSQKDVLNLRRVINATGTVIHTNLGRAPLSRQAEKALLAVSSNYSNLEYSLDKGERGSRHAHLEKLLCDLTGAGGAMVVNNNAAAVFLVLQTLAADREIIISRGELVEIGGSFRMPDVMSSSGVHMVEVGTTNKCYLSDYEAAITDQTALMLKVHTSNYRIVGFTEEVERGELVSLGKKAGIPVVEDLGSGSLVDLGAYGLSREPRVQECLSEGISLVTFSGDKLLGGPQAGVILGDEEMVNLVKSNQLARALRVDKFTLAALEATLRLYWDEERAVKEIPVLSMLTQKGSHLKERAGKMLDMLEKEVNPDGELEVQPGTSTVGGGALPLEELPTYLVKFYPRNLSPVVLARRLRVGTPPVITRIHQDALCIDVRTILEGEEILLKNVFQEALRELSQES